MLNSKDKIKAVITVVEEQKSDSHLLAPSPSHLVASEHLCRTPYGVMKQTVTIIPCNVLLVHTHPLWGHFISSTGQ